MGFVFGIVDFVQNNIPHQDIEYLKKAFINSESENQCFTGSFFSAGLSWNKKQQVHFDHYRQDHFTVLADIRLYNQENLRKEFDFITPGEAFFKAFKKWGLQCVNHLNGDFAVVLIDERQKQVHLFRDHIGARPLVYHFDGKRLVFASNEFGLAKSGLVPLSLSEKTAVKRVFALFGNYPLTVFNSIYKLTPGHFATFSRKKKRITKYWKPEQIKTNQNLTYEDTITQLREKLIQATMSRVTDGKIGTHVSGGLDSTGLACILADHLDDKSRITGYSWTPANYNEGYRDQYDERLFIKDFVEDKHIHVNYLQNKSYERAKNSIVPDFEIQHIEQPTMNAASQNGDSIVFSGWGGDEFVSLSLRSTFGHLFFRFKWLTLLLFVKKLGLKASLWKFRVEVLPLLVPFRMVYTHQPFRWSKCSYFSLSFFIRNIFQILFHKKKGSFSILGRKQFMLNLIRLYHLPDRMDAWSMNAEKVGIEYRYPLLDKDLLDFWFSIPIEYTYREFESRILYKEALKGILTEKIRLRTKKSEGVFMHFLLQSNRNEFPYLANLLSKTTKNGRIPFFKHKVYQQKLNHMLNSAENTEKTEIQAYGDLTNYLRYLNLYQEYIQ
jgi:asparagine synthase (glutamine-hydrolysing)